MASSKKDKFDMRDLFLAVSELPAYRNEWYHVDYWAQILVKELKIDEVGSIVTGSELSAALLMRPVGPPEGTKHNPKAPKIHPVTKKEHSRTKLNYFVRLNTDLEVPEFSANKVPVLRSASELGQGIEHGFDQARLTELGSKQLKKEEVPPQVEPSREAPQPRSVSPMVESPSEAPPSSAAVSVASALTSNASAGAAETPSPPTSLLDTGNVPTTASSEEEQSPPKRRRLDGGDDGFVAAGTVHDDADGIGAASPSTRGVMEIFGEKKTQIYLENKEEGITWDTKEVNDMARSTLNRKSKVVENILKAAVDSLASHALQVLKLLSNRVEKAFAKLKLPLPSVPEPSDTPDTVADVIANGVADFLEHHKSNGNRPKEEKAAVDAVAAAAVFCLSEVDPQADEDSPSKVSVGDICERLGKRGEKVDCSNCSPC